ncbi:MAG: 50S ribosomal protein L15 [Candidatus Magnetoglobus multicellularis str. Araruama]|uniref:Large ribosomal subunit protein uL15 n=1 Tax=Candidatus Magnetoglobus multicellularis str. Araruama TaxID=890399 RepID=A0A1V1PIC0_9BACT|nr:MAG: 50S ribosomal protein L15 [Candidatus Magnetoglobus multicellularis str. Araruama]
MKLHELAPSPGSRKNRKRLGRGVGSGYGKTAGKGSKGFKCRSGGKVRIGFEGGQMPIHRRLPKRGFTNIFKKEYETVNIEQLVRFKDTDKVMDEAFWRKNRLLKGKGRQIKLLGNGDINFPVNVKVHKASKSAVKKIESAGGKVEIIQ